MAHRALPIGVALALAVGALAYLASGRSSSDSAAGYPDPTRSVRHIIPWGAGGATDAAMRGFTQHLERHLGIPIVTENIPGGLSAVGLLHVKSAPPDGYTIGTMTYDVLTLEVQDLAPVSWRDLEPIGMVTEHASALIAPADRWQTLEEFRAAVVAGPGRLRIGNVGTGGIWHQHAGALEQALGGRVTHVPYEAGSGAQVAALLGGEVDANVASLSASLPYVREGALRVLAVMASERDPLVPEAPTFQELGYDLVYGGFRVVVTPKGTPSDVRRQLEERMRAAWTDPAFQAWAEKTALGARWRGSEETRQYLDALAPKVRALMEALGVR